MIIIIIIYRQTRVASPSVVALYTYTSPRLRRLDAGVFRSSVLDTLPLELPPHALSSLSDALDAAVAVTSVSNNCGGAPIARSANADVVDELLIPNDVSSGWLIVTADMVIGLTVTGTAVNAGFNTPRRWSCNVPDRLGSISWIGDNSTCWGTERKTTINNYIYCLIDWIND